MENEEPQPESSSPLKGKKRSPLKGKKRLSKEDNWQRYLNLPSDVLERKWQEISAKVRRVQHDRVDGECWEHPNKPIDSGYVQINLNGSGYGKHQGNYTVHLLAMRWAGTMQPSGLTDADCSHLCHNKICCNPAHLVWEEGRNNKRRNMCPHKIGAVLICPYIHEGPACAAPHSLFSHQVDVYPGY